MVFQSDPDIGSPVTDHDVNIIGKLFFQDRKNIFFRDKPVILCTKISVEPTVKPECFSVSVHIGMAAVGKNQQTAALLPKLREHFPYAVIKHRLTVLHAKDHFPSDHHTCFVHHFLGQIGHKAVPHIGRIHSEPLRDLFIGKCSFLRIPFCHQHSVRFPKSAGIELFGVVQCSVKIKYDRHSLKLTHQVDHLDRAESTVISLVACL